MWQYILIQERRLERLPPLLQPWPPLSLTLSLLSLAADALVDTSSIKHITSKDSTIAAVDTCVEDRATVWKPDVSGGKESGPVLQEPAFIIESSVLG